MSKEDPLFSHHIFLFPFKWTPTADVNQLLAKQTSLQEIDKIFKNIISTDDELPAWQEEVYSIERPVNYNEYNYFYDYVREAIYDTHSNRQDIENSPLYSKLGGASQMLRHYHYKWNKQKGTAFYKIYTTDPHKKEEKKTYVLEVDSILLQFYYTGVGILSFHLNNRREDQKSKEDILWINQYGRRLFPPFFNIPKDKIGKSELDQFKDFNNHLPLGIELAHAITLEIPGPKKEEVSECWRLYRDYKNFKENPFLLPAFIKELLPEEFRPPEKKENGKENPSKQKYTIVPALDDRMFVVSWYGNNFLARSMYKPSAFKSTVRLNYLKNSWWFKYVFVDTGGLSCENEVMGKELIETATNGRWANFGTIYGVTDYSFVLLTETIESLGNFAFVVNHLQTIYYKLTELVLLQRASVQRFSDEVTHISQLDEKEKNETLADRVSSLYMLYIRFVNKIFFREVTAQTQGRELYQLLQSQCSIEKLVKDLDGEINELHNYVLQQQEKERNERLERLTELGAIFLAPSLVVGLYGVSILNGLGRPCLNWVLPSLAVLLIVVAYFSHRAFSKKRWPSFITVMAVALISPFLVINLPRCTIGPSTSDTQLPLIQQKLENIEQQLQQIQLPLPVTIDTTKTTPHEQQ